MRQRLGDADTELVGGDVRQRSSPLQAVGVSGSRLHHRLDALVIQRDQVGVSRGGVRIGRSQTRNQRVMPAIRDPLRERLEVYVGVRHMRASSRNALTSPRNAAA